jgi:hypothetical protein
MAHIDRENRAAGQSARTARGILVHGGSQNLAEDVRSEAAESPAIKLLSYKLGVQFQPCG